MPFFALTVGSQALSDFVMLNCCKQNNFELLALPDLNRLPTPTLVILRLLSEQTKGPRALPAVLLTGPEDLLVEAVPLGAVRVAQTVRVSMASIQPGKQGIEERMKNPPVDAIRPLLRLDGHARAPAHGLHLVGALRALERRAAVHPVARVEDDAGLVGAELGLDAREGAGEGGDDGARRRVLDEEVAVVALARAVGAAVALEARLVARVAQRQPRPAGKVVDGARLGRQDLARRQRRLVRLEVARRVGQVQRVVPDLGRGRVAVGVEVEVGVLSEEDGCPAWLVPPWFHRCSDSPASIRELLTRLVVQRLGRHLDVPLVLAHAVGDARLDVADHALRRVGLVQDGEGDRVGRVRRHVPESVRPVVGSAVQRVFTVVLLRLVRHPVDGVLAVSDPVGVPARDGVVDGVARVLGCACTCQIPPPATFLWCTNDSSRHRRSREPRQCRLRSCPSRTGSSGSRRTG